MRLPSPTGAQDHGVGTKGPLSRPKTTPGPDGQPPGLQIGCNKNKGESLQIPVTVNGVPTHAVVDAGAQATVISEELYRSLSAPGPNSLHDTYLLNAGVGEGMRAKCGLTVSCKIASKTINWDVHVAPIRATCTSQYEPPKIGKVTTLSDILDHLKELICATSEVLTEEQHQHFLKLLLTYQTLFAKSDSDLGYMSTITHKIDTGTAKPVRQPVRRTTLGFQGEEEKHLHVMRKAGVITPSASEWAAPVVLVRKKMEECGGVWITGG